MPLLEPKADALRPTPGGAPAPDRVADTRASGTPRRLRADLEGLLGRKKVLSGVSDLVRYASDASPYRFIPLAVVVPESVKDIRKLMAYARRNGRSLVFRGAGTSLNGQAQGEDILVDVRRHFAGIEVEARGERVRVLPGTVVARVNAALARYGRSLGPDPASAVACTAGGVVADNACGAPGTARDAYRTVASLSVVLPSGTVVDTGDPDADAALAAAEPELCQGLLDLKDEIEADAALTARIRAKYELKNTSGYRLDAFLDGETPVQILRGLMTGSEGTLGFLSEIVFTTFPLPGASTAALLFFPSLTVAATAVPLLTEAGADAVELMDGNALRAAVRVRGAPADWAGLPRATASLLVEFHAPDEAALEAYEAAATRIAGSLGLIAPVASADNAFTRDPEAIARLRTIRKAFTAAVGGARPSGSTLVSQDFAVPPSRLADACEALLELQRRHGFDAAVAGHAADGHLHVLLAIDAARPEDVDRYAAFMDDLCDVVTARFNGSLTAEHATGRHTAPFLELEWGPQATGMMWRIKQLLDPDGILAPRVILDHDPRAHLRGLKTLPAIEAIADPCGECGFCEPGCPSKDLTTTPRQRIALRREMLRQPAGSPVLAQLLEAYGYDAVDTCAGDSLCRLTCPIGIDTGLLMRNFRHDRHSRAQARTAEAVARGWALAERGTRLAVAAADAVRDRVGDHPLAAVTGLVRRAVSPDLVPEWLPELPGAAPRRLPRTTREGAAAVYYPSCVNRVLGEPDGHGGPSLPEAVVALAARAGQPVWIPDDVTGTCCAMIWHSKGYDEATAVLANRFTEAAWGWTDGGRLPLVVDAGSCTLGLTHGIMPYLTAENRRLHGELTVLDSVVWAAERLLPVLTVSARLNTAVLHPTCAMRHLGDADALRAVAESCARQVVIPDDAGCCAFAGDRGLLHEELTEAATRPEAEEVTARGYDAYLSADRMCELGMEHATGQPYLSVLLALESATRPPATADRVAADRVAADPAAQALN